MSNVLFIGETWFKTITHIKGFDSFVTHHYQDASHFLRRAIESGGSTVDHIPAHEIAARFPQSLSELMNYDVIVLSDIGSNSFLITDNVFIAGNAEQNRLEMMSDFVLQGGGLLMVGGYMSFTGIDAKARYNTTPLAEILPVRMQDDDDRVEKPAGFAPTIVDREHAVIKNLENPWPKFLGYNRLSRKEGADVLMKVGADDVFLATGQAGRGRTAAFASDCSPHWGTTEFVQWGSYQRFWANLISYLG